MSIPLFNRRSLFVLSIALLLLACGGVSLDPTARPATGSPAAEAADASLALTVYNQGSALVRDRRSFTLDRGFNEIQFGEVAAAIDPTSVLFRPLSDPGGTTVLEQNYLYDLVGPSALLDKYLGESIRVLTQDGTSYRGRLLSGDGDLILEQSSGEVVVVRRDQVQQFSFPELPQGLITRPTMQWQLLADQAGDQEFEVTYLTGGVGWQADYVLLLAEDEQSLDLDGWVTLNNESGATFGDAQLKLVAGDLQRLAQQAFAADEAELAAEPARGAQVEQREFFEYHLYEIERPVTVKNNESKQIEFVSSPAVPATKFFVYDGLGCQRGGYHCAFYGYPQTDPSYGVASNPKVMVMLEFDTEQVQADLPRGRVRLYQQDVDGAALLIGEDHIDHTPEGERVRLYTGDAFDIVGERIQTDFARPGSYTIEESYEVTLRNHKEEAVEVRVVEHMFRWSDWEILAASQEHGKLDAHTIEFRVQLPAGAERTVHYTVRYSWR